MQSISKQMLTFFKQTLTIVQIQSLGEKSGAFKKNNAIELMARFMSDTTQ
ncbi:hypothetical protein GCM10009409_10350 [Shewanella saliphila]|uniref:Uncharacterized protein n=1 Tax=Shewanella saliphila TaxID=2282698 RepID=A0ABQ2Q5A5_9GAMM|nr:hypothetical protein GCM10009409_10350 [Shewanella saliphila]